MRSSTTRFWLVLASAIALVVTGLPPLARAATVPTVPGAFVGVPPARLLDTRTGIGTFPLAIPPDGQVALTVAGRGGLPAVVGAVALNVTVVSPTAPGHVTVYPSGESMPATSNLNFVAGQTVPNLVIVKVGRDGTVILKATSTGQLNLVADVYGYFLPSDPSYAAAGTFVPLSPSRLLDTRTGLGVPSAGPVPANRRVELRVGDKGGVDLRPMAVVLNITVTAPQAAGHLSARPSGTTWAAETSNLNFAPGQTVPNLTIVKVGSDGVVDLDLTSAGSAHVIADVYGYFMPSLSPGVFAGTLGAVAPARVLDTRIGLGAPMSAVPSNGSVTLKVAGRGGIPVNVGSVVLNITVVGPQAAGHVTAYPSGEPFPDSSNLNFVAGQTVPNLALVKVGADGNVVLSVTSAGPVHLVADVYGSFLATDNSPAGCADPMMLTVDTRLGWSRDFQFTLADGSVARCPATAGATTPVTTCCLSACPVSAPWVCGVSSRRSPGP